MSVGSHSCAAWRQGQLEPQGQAFGALHTLHERPPPPPSAAGGGWCYSGPRHHLGHRMVVSHHEPTHPSVPSLALLLPGPASSPAELARVIHVGTRLNVPFVRVIDGGGSGISPTQDENEAIEGDGGSVLVVCKESGAGRQVRALCRAPSPPPSQQALQGTGAAKTSNITGWPKNKAGARRHLARTSLPFVQVVGASAAPELGPPLPSHPPGLGCAEPLGSACPRVWEY